MPIDVLGQAAELQAPLARVANTDGFHQESADDSSNTTSRHLHKPLDLRHIDALFLCRRQDSHGQRVPRARLNRRSYLQDLGGIHRRAVRTLGADYVSDRGSALGNRPGLSEYQRVNPLHGFDHVAASNHRPKLCGAPGSNSDGGGAGEADGRGGGHHDDSDKSEHRKDGGRTLTEKHPQHDCG